MEPLAPPSLDDAWRQFAAGQVEAAIAQAQALVGSPSDDTEAARAAAALGFFLLQAGRTDEAAGVIEPALQRFAHSAPLHWYAGYLHQRRGDPGRAAQALQAACELDPSLDEAAFALAWVLHDLGRMEDAVAWSAHALALRGTPQRLMQLGWLRQALGRFEAAAQAYREALQSFPPEAAERPVLHLHLAQCLLRLDSRLQAWATLEHALALWPDHAALVAGAAWLRRDAGDTAAALVLVRGLLASQPQAAGAWHLLGVVEQDRGDLQAADEAFAQAQGLDLSLVDALLRRAQIQRQWGRYEGAEWLLDLVLNRQPAHTGALDLRAQVLLDLGRIDEARVLLLQRLCARPRPADLRRLLAVVQAKRGRGGMARRTLRGTLHADPGNVEALRMQGWLALEQGDGQAAVDAVHAVLARVPGDPDAQVQAAFVLAHVGALADAARHAEDAVAQAPDLAEAWRALAQVRLQQQVLDEAEAAVRQALQLAPGHVDSLRMLGRILMAAARFAEAQLALLGAVEARPGDPTPRLELVDAWAAAGRFDEGIEALQALLGGKPDWWPALLRLASLRTEAGRQGAAQACAGLLHKDRFAPAAAAAVLRLAGLDGPEAEAARRLLSLVPHERLRQALRDALQAGIHRHGPRWLVAVAGLADRAVSDDGWLATAALYTASLAEESTSASIARQARDWFRGLKLHAGLNRLAAPRLPLRSDRRPRIGYVASQLHASLLRRVLAAHSGDHAHVVLFTNHAIGSLPAHVMVLPLEPARLAQACAANRLDVVIDAGGLHPFDGQFEVLQAFARRIAPVQLGWLGCWGSTGGLFDGLIADDASVPADHAAAYEEPIHRIHGGQWCWEPPVAAPAVADLPVRSGGAITFGVTARPLRLGPACIAAYARVLAAVPRSSLRFIGEVARDWPLRRTILACMEAQGVGASRISFDPFMVPERYLAWFARIDIVLDSLPGNGGLSLMDPLWMGVPVVTRAGAWAGARQGASILSAVGLTQCIADSDDAFCGAAVALASDLDALSAMRAGLRGRVAASPLLDGRRVAAQVESLCARLKDETRPVVAATPGKDRVRTHAGWALGAWLALPRQIELPVVDDRTVPALSVVVVLYKQAGLTRRTLQALADQHGVAFETIIVDNASDDRTAELLRQVRGARVLRNESNTGFLLAARQGAALCRGEVIAFLNSDAILQAGALAATLRALREDPSIGALGGRVVLTDGGLQEAGNAVFRDGSAGGIGRGEAAFGHAARAARSTDYVSGVFLATPAPLWRMLGGFDTRFAPAYYEDTDYCLRVWQAGLRVVVEPAVLLEHLEWGSASGDSATALMERNRTLFREKHGPWLEQQPWPRALPLDGDRWRSPEDRPRRPRVLFIDNEVPHMFKGGGLPRARLMLHALDGWPLTLYPLWETQDDWRAVYDTLPRSVEVALGHGLGGLEGFLERRRGVYDVVVVSRPTNLEALQPLRQRRADLFADMRLVYDAEALFALREIAMAGVQGRPLARAAARERLAGEIALADGASDVLVVSERDAGHFRAAGHRTHVLSHGIPLRREAPGGAGRQGLLFVGALHPGTPNEDGLLWFIHEVMPLLQARLQRPAVLSVVGVCMSAPVAALAGPQVKVLGAQAVLEPHYDAASVFIAPVRFAGGVPAKVIEAAAAGIPAVASSLLVRQLGWRDGLDILGARDAPAFAAAIALLLGDQARWARQQAAAWEQCARRYDPELFANALRGVLGGAGR